MCVFSTKRIADWWRNCSRFSCPINLLIDMQFVNDHHKQWRRRRRFIETHNIIKENVRGLFIGSFGVLSVLYKI